LSYINGEASSGSGLSEAIFCVELQPKKRSEITDIRKEGRKAIILFVLLRAKLLK
jgi:hypothetical protein